MSMFPTARLCSCGSGEYDEEVFDGHGIYLCRCCDKCRKERLSGYRENIFESYECDEPIEPDYSGFPMADSLDYRDDEDSDDCDW